jgi:hypothetical protein
MGCILGLPGGAGVNLFRLHNAGSLMRPALVIVGTWLSLVEHSLGVRGVGSSNLPVPTIDMNQLLDPSRRAAEDVCTMSPKPFTIPIYEEP